MDQKTGISSLYDEFFQGYGAEIRLSCPDFRPNSTYKPTSTTRGALMVLRLRIAWVMVAVAIAALDFGAIRALLARHANVLDDPRGLWLLLGALPMANALV